MVTLTKEQLDEIKKKLKDADGEFCVEVEFDGLMVSAEGYLRIYGYVEDEAHVGYDNATDAWVETGRDVSVELTGWQVDPATEEDIEVEIAPESVKEVYDWLNAA